MDIEVRALAAGFRGAVSLYATNLESGAKYGLNEDERVRTASTIKLAVMVRAFSEVAAGRAKWDEPLLLREEDKISGSGVLSECSGGLRLPIRDLVHLMIVVSDNTATNLLIDRFGADGVNEEMDKLGLPATRLMRKVLGEGNPTGWSQAGQIPENLKYGLGSTTAREMVTLIEKIERGEVVSKEASKEMIAILKRQQFKDGIGRRIRGSEVASKSGGLDRLRSDVGIVYTSNGRIALAITVDDMASTDDSQDNAGLGLIADLALLLVDGLTH